MDETSELTDLDPQNPDPATETTETGTPHDEAGAPAEADDSALLDDVDLEAEVAADVEADGDRESFEREPEITVESVVEALLFATDSPLPAAKIAQLVGVGDARDVKKHVAFLNERYEQNGNAFRIEAVAKGYQMLTLPAYNGWVSKLLKVRDESKLSPAAMETLTVVAYKQPVLRADVEAIRGVACGELLNKLREMNLVKIVGRAEEPGRPMLYGTTRHFLKVFGLNDLADLPGLEALPAPPERSELRDQHD